MGYRIFSLCALVIALWSSAFVGVQWITRTMDAGEFILYRLIISTLVLQFIARNQQAKSIKGRDLFLVALSGIFGTSSYCLFLAYAQSYSSSAESCFVINTMPVFSALLTWIFYKKKIGRPAILGLLISLTGIGILAYGKINSELSLGIGVFLLLCASISMAIGTVLQKSLLIKYSPVQVISTSICFGTIAVLPFGSNLLTNMSHISLETHMTIWYLAIFPSAIAYLCWAMILKAMDTHRATSLLYVVPIVTALLGYIFLGETLPVESLFGGSIALFGVGVSQLNSRQVKNFSIALKVFLRRNVMTFR